MRPGWVRGRMVVVDYRMMDAQIHGLLYDGIRGLGLGFFDRERGEIARIYRKRYICVSETFSFVRRIEIVVFYKSNDFQRTII